MSTLTPLEARKRTEDWTAHIVAYILVMGFFSIALFSLLGFVDITNPTVAGFVGTALGYSAAKLDGPMSRYFNFRKMDREKPATNGGES